MKEKYYCGPKGTPNFLRSDYFAASCKHHDLYYKNAMYTRKEADRIFLVSMLETSENRLRRFQAYLLYTLVRLFGWIFYGK
jgi:hypothetical protein